MDEIDAPRRGVAHEERIVFQVRFSEIEPFAEKRRKGGGFHRFDLFIRVPFGYVRPFRKSLVSAQYEPDGSAEEFGTAPDFRFRTDFQRGKFSGRPIFLNEQEEGEEERGVFRGFRESERSEETFGIRERFRALGNGGEKGFRIGIPELQPFEFFGKRERFPVSCGNADPSLPILNGGDEVGLSCRGHFVDAVDEERRVRTTSAFFENRPPGKQISGFQVRGPVEFYEFAVQDAFFREFRHPKGFPAAHRGFEQDFFEIGIRDQFGVGNVFSERFLPGIRPVRPPAFRFFPVFAVRHAPFERPGFRIGTGFCQEDPHVLQFANPPVRLDRATDVEAALSDRSFQFFSVFLRVRPGRRVPNREIRLAVLDGLDDRRGRPFASTERFPVRVFGKESGKAVTVDVGVFSGV